MFHPNSKRGLSPEGEDLWYSTCLQNQYLLLNGDGGIKLMLKEAFQLPLPFCFQLFQDMLITLHTAVYPGIDIRIYSLSTVSDPICSKSLLEQFVAFY